MISSQQKKRTNQFTLVELLAAMGILVVMMLFIFQFINAAETAWSQTGSNTRVYENARVAFDLISRDLKSAIASDIPGREIPFSTSPVAFVSATNLTGNSNTKSKLCEIRYNLNSNTLKRQCVNDQNAGWDFYGKTGSSWIPPGTGGDEIIKGVDDFNMTAHWNGGKTPGTLPDYVEIELSLFDENKPEGADENESLRTFTKIVYLGN